MSGQLLVGGIVVLVPAALLAALTSAVLLGWYRRTVVALMGSGSTEAAPAEVPVPAPAVRSLPPGRLALLRRRRRLQVVVAAGVGAGIGAVYALLFLNWNQLEVLPGRYAYLALVMSWPAAPATWVASDGDRRLTALVCAVLLLAPVVIGVAVGAGPLPAVGGWLVFNAVPTLVVAVFFTRYFRSVGICLLGIWLAGLLGASAVQDQLARRGVADAALLLVPNADLVFWGAAGLGLVLTAAVGWAAFAALAHWYAAGGFSDHMLLLGSLCLVFCLDYVAVIEVGNLRLLLLGLTLFAGAGLAAALAYRLFRVAGGPPVRLLVLRVFGEPRQSAPLLDAVTARWRHLGPVVMIGGPDLAVANVEPDKFLTFTSGRLRHRFIVSAADLRGRAGRPVPGPDLDGRHRVDEWYCGGSAWREAVRVLLDRSDRVLLDLRGFTEQRQGTRHELELLAATDALTRTVLLLDARTDRALVAAVLRTAPGQSPRVVNLAGDGDASAVVSALAGEPAPAGG